MRGLLDKSFVLTLIVLDAIAILIGMVSGPFGYDAVSIGASLSAGIISLVIVIYGLASWKKHKD